MPGEFEPHAAVWLGWPTFQWFHDPALDTRATIAQLACTLADRRIPANILCIDQAGMALARDWMEDNDYAVSPGIRFLPIPQADLWVRDYGPVFLEDRHGGGLAVAAFEQNQWGYSTTSDPASRAMSALPGRVAEFLGIGKVLHSSLVSEGGNRIGNGQGVVVANLTVELERNPNATQEDLEAAYQNVLGASKVIWLHAGLREDDRAERGPIRYLNAAGEPIHLYHPQTTGGHVDEFCQFVGPRRILLAEVADEEAASDPVAAANQARLEEAWRILSGATDQNGQPFEIIRIPTPDVGYRLAQAREPMCRDFLQALDYPDNAPPFPEGQPVHIVAAASYVNCLATNELVIAPEYGNPAKDASAQRALEAAYPGRDVVRIDPAPLNYAGGGIHCATQHQPLGGERAAA